MKREFHEDDSKYYKPLSPKDIAEARECKEGLPIDSCRKARMIAMHPDGTYQEKVILCDCSACIIGNFDLCCRENLSYEFDGKDQLYDLDEPGEEPQTYTFTEEDTYVAIYSSRQSFELFYIVHINKKCVAEESKSDIFGHVVKKGDGYFEAYYLEKTKEKKKERSSTRKSRRLYMYIQRKYSAQV